MDWEPVRRDHPFRQFADRDFMRIADIDRAGDVRAGGHQADEALDQVVDVAERPGLAAVAVERDVLILAAPGR